MKASLFSKSISRALSGELPLLLCCAVLCTWPYHHPSTVTIPGHRDFSHAKLRERDMMTLFIVAQKTLVCRTSSRCAGENVPSRVLWNEAMVVWWNIH
ncbi:hypothetical protein BS17DRAFT_132618 [Gyrodon lividus]|nr:hypothetical protein BS17DRAFT_132618 [Gyrodon lividus]